VKVKIFLYPLVASCFLTVLAEEAISSDQETVAKKSTTSPKKKKKSSSSHSSRKVEDQIIVRVNGTNILKSDLENGRIDKAGGKYTLNEAIMEELFHQRASELHMLPSALDVERQLVAFKIQNNLTEMSDEAFEKELKDNGFSVDMYKYQLGRLLAVENVKRAEVSEKSLTTSQEVEAYYEQHKDDPDSFLPEKYHLKTCSIPEIKQPANKNDLLNDKSIEWDDLDWVEKKHLKSELGFVKTMQKGAISDPIKKDDLLEYVLLVDKQAKRRKTLDERYGEIEYLLQTEKREGAWKKFEKTIKDKATVVFLD